MRLDIDADHDSSGSDPDRYLNPCTVDLYRAPRFLLDDTDHICRVSQEFGFSLLSDINARIDVADQRASIGDAQAVTIFNIARRVVIESITLN
jgi:hypothetical protein